jgi:hypothetical protein
MGSEEETSAPGERQNPGGLKVIQGEDFGGLGPPRPRVCLAV